MLTLLLWIGLVIVGVRAEDQCIDNDAEMVKLAADAGQAINGCADVGGWCTDLGQYGDKARELCCDQCGGNEAGDADLSMSLPPADDNDPVHLFLLSGQSECTGAADAGDLNGAGKDAYPKLAGRQSGVWFAGPKGSEDFTILEMEAVNKFGPEISFGQRVHEVTGARVMVVKYCWGGSSVSWNWNPTTAANDWDKEADDGTAAWLANNAGVNFQDKNALFVNQVYTKRRTIEALDAAGVVYEWKAFVWVQGSRDKTDPWEDFGTNTARVFDYTREQVGVWDLPVLDTGSSAQHALRSGKEYATQIVKGCNSVVIEVGGAAENPDSTCQITPSEPCLEDTFIDFHYMDHYGWDPNFSAELKPEWASDRVFHWFKEFPSNQHSAYEGMILKGRMLANAYIRNFTTTDLPPAFAEEDPALLFPSSRCAPGAKPTAENLCWVDLRGEAQAAKACVPQPPVAASTDPTPSPDEETTDSPPPPQCTDDDAALVQLAAAAGHTVTGCADPKVAKANACGYSQVADVCCATCATQIGPVGDAMKSGNPFADPGGGGGGDGSDGTNTDTGEGGTSASGCVVRRGHRLVHATLVATAAAALCNM